MHNRQAFYTQFKGFVKVCKIPCVNSIFFLFGQIPAGTTHWINVEIQFRTTSRPNFNYISTLFQRQMPAGMDISVCLTVYLPHLCWCWKMWFIHHKHNLKLQNRHGVRNCRLKLSKTSIPINWGNFLKVDTNKEGLFWLLLLPRRNVSHSKGLP